MDQLEKLKERWKQQENLPQLSFEEIYKMILKKSSSMVKWIFIISIGEILFWTFLIFITPKSNYEFIEQLGLSSFFFISNILYYSVFIGFIILFFRNYKKISSTDSIKELMKNIIRTRKTVRYFIIYNLAFVALLLIIMNIIYYQNFDLLINMMETNIPNDKLTREGFIFGFFTIQIIFGLLLLGGMLLFYRIIYGIFLKRLYRNYKELSKLEE